MLQVDQAAHAHLEAVLWRDTAFLAGLGVMDYSLLVGLDSQQHRLVIGIIDFIRQVSSTNHCKPDHLPVVSSLACQGIKMCRAMLHTRGRQNGYTKCYRLQQCLHMLCSIPGTNNWRLGSSLPSCLVELEKSQLSSPLSSTAGASG